MLSHSLILSHLTSQIAVSVHSAQPAEVIKTELYQPLRADELRAAPFRETKCAPQRNGKQNARRIEMGPKMRADPLRETLFLDRRASCAPYHFRTLSAPFRQRFGGVSRNSLGVFPAPKRQPESLKKLLRRASNSFAVNIPKLLPRATLEFRCRNVDPYLLYCSAPTFTNHLTTFTVTNYISVISH